MILVILCYAILASTFTLAKAALSYAPPFLFIAVRMISAGSILLGYLLLFDRNSFIIKSKDAFRFLRVALFHIYLAFILEFWALQYVTSSKTCLIYSLTPFIAAFLSYFLLNERLSAKKIGALILGSLGMVPIFLLQADYTTFSISQPDIVLLIAVFCGSYAWFDIQKLMAKGYSLLMINGFAMLVGGIGALTTSYYAEGFSPFPIYNIFAFLRYVAAMIVVSNIIFYNLFGSLLKKYSITFLTFAGFLSPVFGAFFGWLFLGETITWHYMISLLAIIGALFLFSLPD